MIKNKRRKYGYNYSGYIYDGPPIIPPEIAKMTIEELEIEWQKIVERNNREEEIINKIEKEATHE